MSPGPASAPPEALEALEEGLRAYRAGQANEAHVLFQRAYRRAPSDPRLMSWYGLTLVLVERNSNLGISLCDQAIRTGGLEPEYALNKARAHLALGQREHAVKAIARGLASFPLEPSLELARSCVGWRRPPVIGVLGRGNPINRWLGRLRHRWLQRIRPVPEWTPMTLGMLPEGAEPAAPRQGEE